MDDVPMAADGLVPALRGLAAAGPHPDFGDTLNLFGQFVGEWDVNGTLIDDNGDREPHLAEWLFAWVLEGRAVQDVLISPPLAAGAGRHDRFEYGTTIRFYDPDSELWHVTYISPTGRKVHLLQGGLRGEAIVLEGRRASGQLQRWQFSEITHTRFLWRGYVSTDDGATWRLEEELQATRR